MNIILGCVFGILIILGIGVIIWLCVEICDKYKYTQSIGNIFSLRLQLQSLYNLQSSRINPTNDIPMYYINMDKSIVRRQHMEKEANKFGIKLIRIKAIDGGKKFDNQVDGVYVINEYPTLNKRELATTMSHLKAISTAFSNGDEYAIIMEDDVSFELIPFWSENILHTLINESPSDIGIIQLAWFSCQGGNCYYYPKYSIHLQSQGMYCWSCAAYLITRRGMMDILSVAKVTLSSTTISMHIAKPQNTLYQTHGVADQYLYQLTKTAHTGLPLFMPNNTTNDMQTTVLGRIGNHDLFHIRHFEKVLKQYVNIHGSFNKIFQIGFNKCGTTSLFEYFKSTGIKCIHWDNDKIAEQMQNNFQNGMPLLNGYEQFTFFSDFAHIEYFKLLDQQYPNSKFILNVRDKQKWIQSRIKHPNSLKESMERFNMTKEQVLAKWSRDWDTHIANVKKYFKQRPDDLLIYNIEQDTSQKIESFFPTLTFKHKTMGVHNKTL